MARLALTIGLLVMTSACGQSDAEVDAKFAEFCASNPFFRNGPECTDPASLTREQKQEFLDAAPEIDAAMKKFEQESGNIIDDMVN